MATLSKVLLGDLLEKIAYAQTAKAIVIITAANVQHKRNVLSFFLLLSLYY